MLKRLPPRGCAAVLGFSMGTVPWRKILWGAGMSLDKSKGETLCSQVGISEKEKPIYACTSSGQAALWLGEQEKPEEPPGQDCCPGERG